MVPMLPGRFSRTLRHRGPALARWPAAERDAALLLLRLSPRARRTLSDALDFPGPPAADAAALNRMQAGLHRRVEAARALAWAQPRGVYALRAAALAVCAAAGLWLGTALPDGTDTGDVLAVVQVAALGTSVQ